MAKKSRYVYEWPRPMVTVDAAVFQVYENKIKILLIQRGKEPFKGCWALPGGFVEMNEELDDAVARELSEETGLCNVKLQQMYTFGGVDRDPRGRMISVVYMGVVRGDVKKINAGDDASNVRWFDICQLPEKIAFDHKKVIEFAAGKLREKKIQ